MTDLPARRYNEKEVARLLKRASELQQSSPAAPQRSGLTLAELEEIAKEAGLDVASLRQAATELEGTSKVASVGEKLAGAPMRIVLERTLPFEANEASFITMVPAIEGACGGAGQLSQIARTFTWHATRPNSGRTHQVRVTARAGQTTIRIEESYGGLVGGLFGGLLGGVGGGVGLGAGPAIGFALHSMALVVALPILVFTATYASVRYGYKSYIANRRRVLERLMQEISDTLAEPVDHLLR
jgi:hypothetical protein